MTKRQTNTTGRRTGISMHASNNTTTYDNAAAAVVTPGPTDVLFGRGGHVNHNPANQKYLMLVCDRKQQYHTCKKTDKASIAWDIMAELREQDPPTRFLKKDYSTGLWHVVPDSDVRRKISQCLRERMIPVIPTPKKNKKTRRSSATAKKSSTVAAAAAVVSPPTTTSKRTTRSSTRIQIRRPKEEDKLDWETAGTTGVTQEDVLESLAQGGIEQTGLAPQAMQLQGMFTKSREEKSVETVDQEDTDETALPPLKREPARKRSSYYSLTTGTWKDFNPATGTWEEAPSQPSQPVEKESCSKEETVPPPPLPNPVPIKSEESTSRVWSDFFASSLASFTPSIFDFSGAENAWENLLDPATLPQLMPYEDDEESYLGSHASSSAAEEEPPQRFVVHASARTVTHCITGGEGAPPAKKRKTADTSDATSVDAFFNCESMSLGKVLEQSRSLSLSSGA